MKDLTVTLLLVCFLLKVLDFLEIQVVMAIQKFYAMLWWEMWDGVEGGSSLMNTNLCQMYSLEWGLKCCIFLLPQS